MLSFRYSSPNEWDLRISRRRMKGFLIVNVINVVSFFDERMAIQGAILAASLADTATAERPVKFHVFCIGDFQERFVGLVECLSSPSFSVICNDIDNPFDRGIPAAYFNHIYCMRLCVGELLQCDRVLYLDADTFVRESVSDLYDVDLGDKVIAAVNDKVFNLNLMKDSNQTYFSGMTKVNVHDYYRRVIGIKGAYFNSGVLLIDLKKWRAAGVKERCLDFLQKHVTALFCDQDALNFALGDRALLVGYEWNFMADRGDLSDLSSPARGPRIIHFSGPSKPWSPLGRPCAFYSEYWEHVASTPYGDALVEQFIGRASFEAANLEASIASNAAIIPSPIRPIEIAWAKYVPSVLLKPLAEALCTLGRGRVHRAGVAMWNVFKSRQLRVSAG